MKPAIVLDIETIPRPLAELERLMPPEMLNPVMPDELNPLAPAPDFAEKCPQYDADKLRAAYEALPDESPKKETALRRLHEAQEKRSRWIHAAQEKYVRQQSFDRQKWEQDQKDARRKFIEKAALDPARGQVKLIGVRVHGYATQFAPVVFAWEPDPRVNAALIAQAGREGHGYNGFLLEKQAIAAAFKYIEEKVRPKLTKAKRPGRRAQARIGTFYGNTFDLPFLARRGAILGSPSWFTFLRRWKRGRYLDADTFVDLCDEWQLADREAKTGGMKALARLLGSERPDSGSGANFWEWYQANPEEGVQYLLNDLADTALIGKALGFIV